MQELVFVENGYPMTDSLRVAEAFEKNHKDVLRDIRELDCSEDFRQRNFALSSYKSGQNKDLPQYNITQDGFSFLVMGYTGREAARFKERYIAEFNRMRDIVMAQKIAALTGEQKSTTSLSQNQPEKALALPPLPSSPEWKLVHITAHSSYAAKQPVEALGKIGVMEEGQLKRLFGLRQSVLNQMVEAGELVRTELRRGSEHYTLYSLGLRGTALTGQKPFRLEEADMEEILERLIFVAYCCHLKQTGEEFQIEGGVPPFAGTLVLTWGSIPVRPVLVVQRPLSVWERVESSERVIVLAASREAGESVRGWFAEPDIHEFASFLPEWEVPPPARKSYLSEKDPFNFDYTNKG